MGWRAYRCLFIMSALVAALGACGFLLMQGRNADAPLLTTAPIWSQGNRLVVGKLVHVSKANQTIPHQECVAAADPAKPERLLVAAIYSSEKWGETRVAAGAVPARGVVGYYSEDGGETWKVTFEQKGDPQNSFIDPALAFGPSGSAHLVCMRLRMNVFKEKNVFVGDPEAGCLEFWRSPDGGKTWQSTTSLPPHIDRPWIAVDCTNGPYRDRLYCRYLPFVRESFLIMFGLEIFQRLSHWCLVSVNGPH